MNLRRLKLRARALFAPRRVERDLNDELAFHIERETRKHIASGISPAEARSRAMARFGSVTVAADECRDTQGTARLDNLIRDVRYAFRSFRRSPLVALTIVTTVALGLGLVAVVFTFLNEFIFRVDDVRRPYELFAVQRPLPADGERESFTRPQFDALVRETGVFSDVFAMTDDIDSRIESQRLEGTLVTGNFFQALGVSAARGRTLTPADERGEQHAIVLSHGSWSRYFADGPDVLSRTVQVNGMPFQVVGVMPQTFRGLMVSAPDFWAPISVLGQLNRNSARKHAAGLNIIGRLKPGLSREQALAELMAWDARQATAILPRAASSVPVDRRLELEPRLGTVPMSADVLVLFTPLFFAFGLILMIGCANVANLLLARAVSRQREIGIRLAIGASRRRIISQLLTESLLLALVSAALAFGISRLGINALVYALTSSFPSDFGSIRLPVPPPDWRVALFLVAGAMVSTLIFALAPALQATRVELVRAMRGEVVRDARPGRSRNALLAIQVTASALLLICSAVFLRSALAAASVDPGFRTTDTVMVFIANENMRNAVLDAVRSDPSVVAMTATGRGGIGGRSAVAGSSDETALAGGLPRTAAITYEFVSPEFFSVLDIDIVRGRGFASTERNASVAVAVVSESVARQLWPGGEAVGQILRIEPDPKSTTTDLESPPLLSRVVVGVAREVPGFRFAGMRLAGAGVYLPTSAEAAGTSLTLRVHGDPEPAARALTDRLTAIDPTMGEVATWRLLARMETYFLQIGFWLTLVLGALALLLTLSGLFSVLSYLVEQRTREIGVRMTLGATSRSISTFVLSQSARPVAIGLLLGGGLTAALGAALLATPAAELIGSSVRLFDPVAYAAGVLVIVAACASAALVPMLRAGRIDPIAALRRD